MDKHTLTIEAQFDGKYNVILDCGDYGSTETFNNYEEAITAVILRLHNLQYWVGSPIIGPPITTHVD